MDHPITITRLKHGNAPIPSEVWRPPFDAALAGRRSACDAMDAYQALGFTRQEAHCIISAALGRFCKAGLIRVDKWRIVVL